MHDLINGTSPLKSLNTSPLKTIRSTQIRNTANSILKEQKPYTRNVDNVSDRKNSKKDLSFDEFMTMI